MDLAETARVQALRRQARCSLQAARLAFDEAVTRFIERPQFRCYLERLSTAAVELHDEGVADLERRLGRQRGCFGGRLAPTVADSTPETAARVLLQARPRRTGHPRTVGNPAPAWP